VAGGFQHSGYDRTETVLVSPAMWSAIQTIGSFSHPMMLAFGGDEMRLESRIKAMNDFIQNVAAAAPVSCCRASG
jgi:hypothetical protein